MTSAGRTLLVAGVAIFLAACGQVPSPLLTPAPSEWNAPSTVKFIDIDGPPVTIEVNGSPVGTLTCGRSLVADPGAQAWPILPWQVRVLRKSGASMKDVAIGATATDTTVIIRADGVVVLNGPGSYGPAPTSPCPAD